MPENTVERKSGDEKQQREAEGRFFRFAFFRSGRTVPLLHQEALTRQFGIFAVNLSRRCIYEALH